MTVITPPLFQTVDAVYDGSDLGRPYRDLVGEGVVGSGDMAVAQRGAGANMSVDIAAGVAWVKGDDSALQPTYRCYNDSTVNIAVTAADASNPRIDIVIAEVRDAAFAGVSTDWRPRVVAGTPAGSPAVPATPNNAIKLADVSVPALDTTIGTAQITDRRPHYGPMSGASTALPASPTDGQIIVYTADATNGVQWMLRYNAGSASAYKWEFIGGPVAWVRDAASSTTTSTSYTDLAAGAMTGLVHPLAGDYDLTFGCGFQQMPVAALAAWASVSVGGAAATDADGVQVFPFSGGNHVGSVHRVIRKTAITAGTTSRLKHRVTGSIGTFAERYLGIIPVRVA